MENWSGSSNLPVQPSTALVLHVWWCIRVLEIMLFVLDRRFFSLPHKKKELHYIRMIKICHGLAWNQICWGSKFVSPNCRKLNDIKKASKHRYLSGVNWPCTSCRIIGSEVGWHLHLRKVDYSYFTWILSKSCLDQKKSYKYQLY